jgi:hypothetical protein
MQKSGANKVILEIFHKVAEFMPINRYRLRVMHQ